MKFKGFKSPALTLSAQMGDVTHYVMAQGDTRDGIALCIKYNNQRISEKELDREGSHVGFSRHTPAFIPVLVLDIVLLFLSFVFCTKLFMSDTGTV